MDDARSITLLNGLIKTTLDSMRGFEEAANDSKAGGRAEFFRQMAQERSAVASQLQAHVRSMGGEPQDHSSLTAAAHRGFMNLKELLMGSDDKAIIEEVERGEDFIKERYETVLAEHDLPAQCRQAVEEAYQSVRKGHDQVSAMKHQMQGTTSSY